MQSNYTREDGTPFTKEEFLQKLKTDKEFNNEFGNKGIDQISELIRQLKEEPDSRRMVVNAWAVHDLPKMVLPPCHYGFQVYTRELSVEERLNWAKSNCPNIVSEPGWVDLYNDFEGAKIWFGKFDIGKTTPTKAISLMFNMRSTDVGLGLGFNLASYGLLLMMIAKQVNMVPDELVYNGGDVHLYLNHTEPIKEQLTREPYELPIVKLSDRTVNDISEYTLHDIELEGYQSHPTIKLPLSN